MCRLIGRNERSGGARLMKFVMRQIREGLLSVYVVLFEISRSKGDLRIHSAVSLMSIVLGFILLGFVFSIHISLGYRMNYKIWLVGGFALLLHILNYYLTIKVARAEDFRQEFKSFSSRKRARLTCVAVILIVSSITAVVYSALTYKDIFPPN